MNIYIVSIENENSPRLNKFLAQNFFEQGQLPITRVGVKGGRAISKRVF